MKYTTRTLQTVGEYNTLTTSDRAKIGRVLLKMKAATTVIHVRLRIWSSGSVRLDGIYTMSFEDERRYLDSGGRRHHIDRDTMNDLIAGKLE
jgi:hypothetical protein